ncbi:hypothetical protein BG004_001690 [Podila humilis]|nr:hypothetical protein BG004_001690 [Podila humilis]
MYIPGYIPHSPDTGGGGVLEGILLGGSASTIDNTNTHPSSDPSRPSSPTSRRTQTVTYMLPVMAILMFLLIALLTLLIACCLYRRFKATNISPSPSSSPWRLFRFRTQQSEDGASHGQDGFLNYHHRYDQQYLDSLDDEARAEHERLLARRRSTSYYDANRSRAPVPVVIRYDTKGRPISTWSTASSVAAQRGEELSQWSRRRDDLIRIYGKSQQRNSSSMVAGEEGGLEEEDEPDEESDGEEHASEEGGGGGVRDGRYPSASPTPRHDDYGDHDHNQQSEQHTSQPQPQSQLQPQLITKE